MRIGIVAGEASGDLLASGLIQAIKQRYPDAQFEGIAGPKMIAAGCVARYPAEKLAVMGFVEVLGRYRELSAIRKKLIQHFSANPPDVFIGVDAPDFNLGLARKLKEKGIKTVHYVSPSVWAWRQYRVKKIAKSVDLMLTLFPFEAQFYQGHQVPVEFVGHPLADMIPLNSDKQTARQALAIAADRTVFALLPGSRMSEVGSIAQTMLDAAVLIKNECSTAHFVVPLTTSATREKFQEMAQHKAIDVQVCEGNAREVMAAADIVLVASGTATLEALLLKRPMVVAYRLAKLTYFLASRMVKTPYVSLPNLLVGEKIVEELIQDELTPERLAQEALKFVKQPELAQTLTQQFNDVHQQLKQDASNKAADAVLKLIT